MELVGVQHIINNQVFVWVSTTYWIHGVMLSNKCKESHSQLFCFVAIVCCSRSNIVGLQSGE
jgi:hypothetical protein